MHLANGDGEVIQTAKPFRLENNQIMAMNYTIENGSFKLGGKPRLWSDSH